MNPGSLSPLPFLPHVAQCIRVSCAPVHNLYYLPSDTWESALGLWLCQKQRLPLHLHLSVMAFRAEYKPSAEMILLSHLATFAYHLILHLLYELFLWELQNGNSNMQKNIFKISLPLSASLPWKTFHLAYLCASWCQCQKSRVSRKHKIAMPQEIQI